MYAKAPNVVISMDGGVNDEWFVRFVRSSASLAEER